jgi:dethiobiotin synthetase
MITSVAIPGLQIVGESGAGKTVIACAIAHRFAQRGASVAVLKPIDTGCVHRREGLVSEDAELLAHFASSRHPLDLICPQRYYEDLIPSLAAKRSRRPVDLEGINRSIRLMSSDSDLMIVESVSSPMTPIDDKYTSLELSAMLKLPVIVAANPTASSISLTLLAIRALRSTGLRVAGVVIDRYPADTPDATQEAAPREIERHGKTPLLAIVPDEPMVNATVLPAGIVSAINQVDWSTIIKK